MNPHIASDAMVIYQTDTYAVSTVTRYKINIKVGKKIKRIRKQKKLSQEDVADKAKLHLTTFGRIERGEANPPVYTLYKIAQALKTSIKELFS